MNSRRRLSAYLATLAVATGVVFATVPARAAAVSVVEGDHYAARIFPDDYFTVADGNQVTGRRVNFRAGVDFPNCDSTNYSICDTFAMLNQLDGFDIQPRVTVPLSGSIKLGSVNDSDFYIADAGAQFVSGMRQLVFDPATNTLAGISDKQLPEHTSFHVIVTSGIRDAAGNPIDACGGSCSVGFTTRTASGQLENIRRAMDSAYPAADNAYRLAGFANTTASRQASFTQNGVNDVFAAPTVGPSIADPVNAMQRLDQTTTDPNNLSSSAIPNLIPPGGAGYFAFGSYYSPRYQFLDAANLAHDNNYSVGDGQTNGVIAPVPTKMTPDPFGKDQLGIIVVTPNPSQFPPPWPVAIYGPGFTRSKFDIFVSADYNAALGIATVATDPAGHAFGPNSKVTVTTDGGSATTFLGYGRGRDLDGNGCIGDGLNDGVGPTDHKTVSGACGSGQHVTGDVPSRKPIDGLQSGLSQTVVDNMALARSIKAGMVIPGIGCPPSNCMDPNRIMYYGISFGGIYGAMLMGTDPLVKQGVLNVPGGPIVDIARLSSFRGDLATTISHGRPNLLNGGPGRDGFTEDLPLRGDPSLVVSHPGAMALQELFGSTNWYDRSGSPETFAPLIRLRPGQWSSGYKNFLFQTAYGDGTTTDPAAATIYRAGQVFDRVVFYRNDKTPTYSSDPHGWLADPTLAGRTSGQHQLAAFLATGQVVNPNPAWLEVPVADPNNLECLHYADPQTGQAANRQPYPMSGDCASNPHGAGVSGGGNGNTARANGAGTVPGQGVALPNTAGAQPRPDALGPALLASGVAVALLTVVGMPRRRQRRQ